MIDSALRDRLDALAGAFDTAPKTVVVIGDGYVEGPADLVIGGTDA